MRRCKNWFNINNKPEPLRYRGICGPHIAAFVNIEFEDTYTKHNFKRYGDKK